MTERLKVTMQEIFFFLRKYSCGNVNDIYNGFCIYLNYVLLYWYVFKIIQDTFYIMVFSAEWAVIFILLSYIICRFSNYRNGNGLGALFSYQIAGALMVLSCGH